ncbi:DUF354 domain-containing protein [Halocatena pleomorpha]|uniref:DUF354 domain-containing protein n=1 Tax=Halocatena pleomorpha TaxID=1785090 RepID=A0A3P3RJS3_9EURY|nr:DUF354 domain-containing protein [Halocatena pleomorpha]RRJ33652.1 DUF354 domain-containing protein [Halocatena pleomorpha]
MRYVFFTNTPAHVHLYKHVVRRLRAEGHAVSVMARDYGCTTALLDWHDIDHTVYGACDTTRWSLLGQLPQHYIRILTHTRAFDPDVIFGMGAYAAHAGAFTRTPTVLILDSEPTGLDHAVSMPFARTIVTPQAFRKDLGTNHYVFVGFKESAYLHPGVYEPSTNIRKRLGLGATERFVLIRFNAFGSHHDVGQGGFSEEQRRTLIERLADHATVFVSDEGGTLSLDSLPARPFDDHPGVLHDALAEASLLVADTQTMVTEAALLGTPAIRSNSFVGPDDMGNFLELESNGLVYNLRSFDTVLKTAERLLDRPDLETEWRRKRDRYVADMVDLSSAITSLARASGDTAAVDELHPYSHAHERRTPKLSQQGD